MSYYPSIDYVGAAQGIVNNLSDLQRVDREREATAMKQELQNKQMTLYNLQAQKEQMQLENMQRDQLINKNLGADILLHQEAGDFNPSITNQVVPDYTKELGGGDYSVPGEKNLYSINSPKMNQTEIVSKALLAAGKIPEWIKLQQETVNAKKVDEEDFRAKVKDLREWAERFPSVATAMAKSYAKKDKRFEAFSEFNYGPDGNVQNIVKNPTDGKVVGWYERSPDGKWTFQKVPEPKTPSLDTFIQDKENAIAKGDMEAAAAAENKIQRHSQATVEGKREFVFKPEGPTSDQKNLAQINAQEKAAGEPLTTMKEFLAGKKGPAKEDTFGFGGKPAPAKSSPKADKSGFVLGEVKDVPGKGKYKYIGNDQWQKQ